MSAGNVATASVQRMQIERVIRMQTAKMPMAEFLWEHKRLCLAYVVVGVPFIQVCGGQMRLDQAGAVQVAIEMAKEWLLGQLMMEKVGE